MKHHPIYTAMAICFAALSASQVIAEEKTESLALEVIEVTAQKTSENLNEVPISMNVVGGEFVDAMGVTQLDDLSSYIPNFNITESTSGMNISMRGIGSGTNKGFEQSVGMFIDGIYSSRQKQFAVPFFDVDRIEILRGPQGVLFGKNTTAGAVSVISARPDDFFNGKISTEYDFEYEDVTVTGVINGPISDTLNARFAARISQQDEGYIENTLSGVNERLRDEELFRLSIDWSPIDNLDVYSKLEYSKQDIQGGIYQLLDFGSYEGLLKAFDPEVETDINLRTSTGAKNLEHHITTDALNGVIEATYEINNMRIVSVTGYSQYDSLIENEDSDFTSVPLIWFDSGDEFEQFSQELRFESVTPGVLEYVGGLYYQSNEFFATPRLAAQLSVVGMPDTENERVFDQESTTWSAFGQVTWNISDALNLKAGLRYNDEKKNVSRALEIQEYGTDIPETDPTTLYINAMGLGIINYSNNDSRTESHWSPALALQYTINDDAMTYAKYSRGYKGGGFDASDLNGTSEQYDEEQVDGFEVGTKLTLWDGRMDVNAALFYTDYQNLQVYSMSGVRFITTNAAEATSQGLEVDSRVQLTESLMLNASFAFLDASYDKFETGSCTYEQLQEHNASGATGPCIQDLGGRTFVRAPELQANLGLNHVLDFESGAFIISSLNVSYTDEQYVQASLPEHSLVSSNTIVDANITYTSPNENWIFKLVARNITDERVITGTNAPVFFDDTVVASINSPRTIMLGVEYRFE
ncbi:TonB-dependent receptor [Thalassotalea sp. ND16A]|uniref:TonB-dependent receptor n=1 Tax=Thalassotalea sp. ND16A TaxID=1535422 RepID=UPI00051A4EEC|nr:TonB-dependent receptor [Thalassotalea sp. ND16A]KGJ87860.1 hypothetical protein ND16A_2774 [Thalassotalea sp. ND16A]